MDDATLARLEHVNMLDWLRIAFTQVLGAIVRFEDGVAVAATGLPAPFFNELWKRDGATVYTGCADGRPVTSGFSIRSGDTLGIFTIATEPDARGRGFGAAMTGRLIADGDAAGCTIATLQASRMGRPIYERLGFRLVQEYEVYVEPRAAGDSDHGSS